VRAVAKTREEPAFGAHLTTDHQAKINLDICAVSGQSFISPLKVSPAGCIFLLVSYAEELATSYRHRAYPPAAGIIPVVVRH